MVIMAERRGFRYVFPVIFIIALAGACAKISSPSGGPKDIDPPFATESEPLNGATNFSDNRIEISFNEYVTLDNVYEKFMASPPMARRPEISIRGKKVVIEFEEELLDSTTYTFYFQDAIKDITEGNPVENFQFVFATGPVIDSLSVHGNVLLSANLEPPKDALILLYRDEGDSAVYKKLPTYISRVDKNGYFRIDNVSEGDYRLYALRDADNSKNFNLPDEEFAFYDTIVKVTTQNNYLIREADSSKVTQGKLKPLADTIIKKGEYQLFMFTPPKKTFYLTSSSRSMSYNMKFTLSLPPDSTGFGFDIPGTGENSWFTERSKNNDTIVVWLTDTALYRQPIINPVLRYPFTDTTGKVIVKYDTIPMRFLTPRATRGRTRPTPLRPVISVSPGYLKPGEQISIDSPTPFREPDTSKIFLYEIMEDKSNQRISYTIDKTEGASGKIRVRASLKPGRNYLFISDSTALGNIYGEVSDSTAIRFTVRESGNYGKLILNIKGYTGKRIIQLLSSDEKLVREIVMEKDGKVEFPLLERGSYRLRVIYDIDGNGKWSPGDFSSGRKPEPVSYMPREIEMIENWENQIDWDISILNFKKFNAKVPRGTSTGR